MTASAPVSVAVPTIGRTDQLRRCLASIAACVPEPAEIVVVDQSENSDVAEVTRGIPCARVVSCEGRGIGRSVNAALAHAANEVVLVTHDDCIVDRSWVGAAWAAMGDEPERLLTGRVLPMGDPDAVPSTIDDPIPRDYVHRVHFSVLYPNNMAVPRSTALALGGFDERIVPAAEDNDFCYRWLGAGLRMRYEPSMVIWHCEWRTRAELERLYVDYAIGDGMFYAKHLRRRDLYIARRLLAELVHGARGTAARHLHGRPRWSDWRQGVLRGLPIGLMRGWGTFKRDGTARE